MNWFYLFILMLFSPLTWAGETYPPACHPIEIKSEVLTLPSAKMPRLILIHNFSSSNVWLTKPTQEASASAGWNSYVHTKHWTALYLEKGDFELACTESQPGHEQQISCQGLISACLWQDAKAPDQLSGSFWAAEDLPLNELLAHLADRSFSLPTPSS